MLNPLEITLYLRTGYSLNDEPASDAVIESNDKLVMALQLIKYDPIALSSIVIDVDQETITAVDYAKIVDTETGERWYYFVVGHSVKNDRAREVRLVLDAFATVGLSNISFFGNIVRRSLADAEKDQYPRLAEPWGPRRPLRIRKFVIDLNVNKTLFTPAHISTAFEEAVDHIEHPDNPLGIDVPITPLGLVTTRDELSYSADIPIGYPNPAANTTHSITTPWGSISYTTQYEQYHNLAGGALTTFLAKAKKYASADLVYPPFYRPSPPSSVVVDVPEIEPDGISNPKAGRFYTTITIRALASPSSLRTFSDTDTFLQPSLDLAVVIAPDKNGGFYVIPKDTRDTGKTAYTYLEGVYSPFEMAMHNMVGDTAAKYAADGTTLLNTALAALYRSYIDKINALQYEGMQAKYFKDLGNIKNVAMALGAVAMGAVGTAVAVTDAYVQNSSTSTSMPSVRTTTTGTQSTDASTTTTTSSGQTNSHTITNGSQSVGGYTDTYNVRFSGDVPYTTSVSHGSHTINLGDTRVPSISNSGSSTIRNGATTGRNSTDSTTQSHTINANQSTTMPSTRVTTTTNTTGTGGHTIKEGANMAEAGIPDAFRSPQFSATPSFGTLQTILMGSFRNEAHTFMLGNLNDYINRWVSIQNDIHNGKTANLFKNVNLVGSYNDYNKLAGKYEIIVSYLDPMDSVNFDIFLDHFGHAVDEYSRELVRNVRPNYNYTMVGEDAVLSNSLRPQLNGQILTQFRTGVRVWTTLVRPENYV